ncbi:hypothetical protein KL86SPO_31385 [uncultured Sporomusa sp.]|uniref:Uncharacterized protein n=1 Tax=uncultured Sporomusa sp. TaxID=307249 RepID=A0A212LUM6_9FIRM|nr:hypothetical protein KL86SPO_31385 [uncultured Sporomusa sp.]
MASGQYNKLQVNKKIQIRLIGGSTKGQDNSSAGLSFWPFFVLKEKKS